VTHPDAGTPMEARIVLTTEGDSASADRLASALIDARIAACVTMHTVRSRYRWDDALHDADETQLVIKTTPERVGDVVATILEHHSYEVPEVIALEAYAGAAYGAWIHGEVG
jgi:periplasmic divalent cation tolerance protein